MSRNKVIDLRGIRLRVDYTHQRAVADSMDGPGYPEHVELNAVTLAGGYTDIYALLDEPCMNELLEAVLQSHRDDMEAAAEAAAEARREHADHVLDDWLGEAV